MKPGGALFVPAVIWLRRRMQAALADVLAQQEHDALSRGPVRPGGVYQRMPQAWRLALVRVAAIEGKE